MLAPLSWLREYVPIKLALKDLTERMSEVGVGVEGYEKGEDDTIFDLEITPNRPDLLCMTGIAREIAAIEKVEVKIPSPTLPKAPKEKLAITIKNDYSLCERYTGIVIDNITIKDSPLWLSERLTRAGLRSINNVVDITNYVMLELGNPIHAFDYDQIKGHVMHLTESVGDEAFTSVDNIAYKLPKGAIIIKDEERIIDLCGIKGGLNSGITHNTKRIFLHVPVYNEQKIRLASLALGLRSDASNIFEKGVNKGGTVHTVARCVELLTEYAGATVASELIDLKKKEFRPLEVSCSFEKLRKVSGINIEDEKAIELLRLLNLSPKKEGEKVTVTVPTYRTDLAIEEDIIEEVIRLYGYNKLPKTLPKGEIRVEPIPFKRELTKEARIKEILTSIRFNEVQTYSLVFSQDVEKLALPFPTVRVSNPVSRDYDTLRPVITVNLLKAIAENKKHTDSISLFEVGNVYHKQEEQKSVWEMRALALVSTPSDYYKIKGAVEVLFEDLGIPVTFSKMEEEFPPFHPVKKALVFSGKTLVGVIGEVSTAAATTLGIPTETALAELSVDELFKLMRETQQYTPIPKYPPIIEDMSFAFENDVYVGEVMDTIKKVSALVKNIELIDVFESSRTFRITYQHKERNLTNNEVAKVRNDILQTLKSSFKATAK